jgi:hypothetical protein
VAGYRNSLRWKPHLHHVRRVRALQALWQIGMDLGQGVPDQDVWRRAPVTSRATKDPGYSGRSRVTVQANSGCVRAAALWRVRAITAMIWPVRYAAPCEIPRWSKRTRCV